MAVYNSNVAVSMDNAEKKDALWVVLHNQISPVGISDLLRQLGSDFSERTVRRWFAQGVSEGALIKVGEKRNTKYASAFSFHFNACHADILQQIKKPLYQRKPVAYNFEWVRAYKPNINRYLDPKVWALLRAFHENKESRQDPAGTYARKIYNRLLIDLSYNSSRLEGNTYSLLETEKLIMEGIASTDKLDEEKIMILNHKEAIRYLIENASKIQVGYDEICTLHYLLSDGLIQPASAVGRVRDHAVRISGSTYITLEGGKSLEDELHYISEVANGINDPYEQSFFLLVHIAYLQAFTDVNKRTARLSANIPLIKNNLVPFSFKYVDKDDYISAMLAIYEFNDVALLADLFATSYQKTSEEYAVTAEVVGFDEVRVRYRTQRRQIIRDIILKKITGDGIEVYINEQTKLQILENDQARFKENIREDIAVISPSRLVGLGITIGELKQWQVLSGILK